MEADTEKLINDVLNLPLEIRAVIAKKLIASIDINHDFEIPEEWKNEIKRRCNDIDEGRAELIDAEDVFAKAFKELE